MPEIPRMVPSRRFFARIDRFECACPSCGRLIFAAIDKRYLPPSLLKANVLRDAARSTPRREKILRLFWNPHTQRLQCPWCEKVYSVGVVFHPVPARGHRRAPGPAPDVVPTAAEIAEMRRLASGWITNRIKPHDEHANLVVTAACSCRDQGTDPSCPVHGELALRGTSEGGESGARREE